MISRLNNTMSHTISFGRPWETPKWASTESSPQNNSNKRPNYRQEQLISKVEEKIRLNKQSRRKLAEDIVNMIKRELR